MEAAAAMSILTRWRDHRKCAASSASQEIPLKEFLSSPLPEERQSEGLQVDLVAPPCQLPDYKALGVSALDILPIELRLQIWEHVMLVPRLVAVEGEARGKDWRSKTPPPVTLFICRESREHTLKFYKLRFGIAATGTPPQIYFNPTIDTLYFGQCSVDPLLMLFANGRAGWTRCEQTQLRYCKCPDHEDDLVHGRDGADDLEIIKYLAVNAYCFFEWEWTLPAPSLFKRLKELTIAISNMTRIQPTYSETHPLFALQEEKVYPIPPPIVASMDRTFANMVKWEDKDWAKIQFRIMFEKVSREEVKRREHEYRQSAMYHFRNMPNYHRKRRALMRMMKFPFKTAFCLLLKLIAKAFPEHYARAAIIVQS